MRQTPLNGIRPAPLTAALFALENILESQAYEAGSSVQELVASVSASDKESLTADERRCIADLSRWPETIDAKHIAELFFMGPHSEWLPETEKWLVGIVSGVTLPDFTGTDEDVMLAFTNTAKVGYLAVSKWMMARKRDVCIRATRSALMAAARNGHVDIMEEIMLKFPKSEWMYLMDLCAENASLYGHLNILKYLQGIGKLVVNRNIIRKSIEEGHVHVIKWLVLEKHEKMIDLLAYDTLEYAIIREHFEMLDFLVDNHMLGYAIYGLRSIANKIAEYGSPESMQWMHSRLPFNLFFEGNGMVLRAATCGNVAMLDFLLGKPHMFISPVEMKKLAEERKWRTIFLLLNYPEFTPGFEISYSFVHEQAKRTRDPTVLQTLEQYYYRRTNPNQNEVQQDKKRLRQE